MATFKFYHHFFPNIRSLIFGKKSVNSLFVVQIVISIIVVFVNKTAGVNSKDNFHNDVDVGADTDVGNDVECNFKLFLPGACSHAIIDVVTNTTTLTPMDLTVLNFKFLKQPITKSTNGELQFCDFDELLEFPAGCIGQNKRFRYANYARCPEKDTVELDGPILWTARTTFSQTNVTYNADTTGLIMECYSSQVLQLRTDAKNQYSGIGVQLSQILPRNRTNVVESKASKITIQIPRNFGFGVLQGNTGNYTLYYQNSEDKGREAIVKTIRLLLNDRVMKSTSQRTGSTSERNLEFHSTPAGLSCEASSRDNLYLATIGGANPLESKLRSNCLQREAECHLKRVGIIGTQQRPRIFLGRKEMPQNGIFTCTHRNESITLIYFFDLDVFTSISCLSQFCIEIVEMSNLDHEDPHEIPSDALIRLKEDDNNLLATTMDKQDETRADVVPMVIYDDQILNLECQYIPYILVPTILWKLQFQNQSVIQIHASDLNSKDIHDEKIYNINSTLTVDIKSAKFNLKITKDMKRISCGASYWDSPVLVESHLNITVLDSLAPEFRNMQSDQNTIISVNAGQDFMLNCKSDIGRPTPTYEWEFNGRKIISNDSCMRIFSDSSTGSSNMSICNARQSHIGTFTCRAINFKGSDEKRFSVNVITLSSKAWIFFGVACVLIVLLLPIILVLYRIYLTQRSRLSELEIAAFENGDEKELRKGRYAHENAQYLPYNKEYEILWNDFKMEEGLLGEGAYGIVHKGRINGRIVAAKTVRPTAEKAEVLALLSELKIMIYLNKHENIVELVGACTSMLKQGRPFVFVEFCDNGDFHSFLKKCRPYFTDELKKPNETTHQPNLDMAQTNIKNGFTTVDFVHSSTNADTNSSSVGRTKLKTVSTIDLFRWAAGIASGMEYLESKKVIHGDLAARNVLLTSSFGVKITDFGLSRQLQKNYTQYVKKQQAALPWRYLAIESLCDMVFTSKSDVWAFGVTLWEMFSLAEVPFAGHTWTFEFMDSLKNGLRLPKPQYANGAIYDIMMTCWRTNPNQRPGFTQLKNAFVLYSNSDSRHAISNLHYVVA